MEEGSGDRGEGSGLVSGWRGEGSGLGVGGGVWACEW